MRDLYQRKTELWAIYGEVNVSVEKCVEIKGDYVEKQQSCFISVILKLGQAGNFWTLLRATIQELTPLTFIGFSPIPHSYNNSTEPEGGTKQLPEHCAEYT